jgi:hypothetical protein
MPTNYEIRPAERLIILRFVGELVAEDLIDILRRLYGDPQFDESFNCLIDNRASIRPFTRNDLERVYTEVQHPSRTSASRPRLAIAVGSEVQFGVSRMFQGLVKNMLNLDIAVFRDLEDAAQWIASGAPPPARPENGDGAAKP